MFAKQETEERGREGGERTREREEREEGRREIEGGEGERGNQILNLVTLTPTT